MEKIFLYNTLTRKREEFKPIKDGEVLFYQCGPTVYWTQHIGNLRAATLGDIIRRVFEYDGYNVRYIKNYTDVGHLTSDGDTGEDKMEKGVRMLFFECAKCKNISPTGIVATENAFNSSDYINNTFTCVNCGAKNTISKDKMIFTLTPEQIAKQYIKIYEDNARDLNIKPPTIAPRATDHIHDMQRMVAILLEKGFAYATPLAIYFDISKFPNYTALSGQNLEKNIAGEGAGEVSDPAKKNPHDFVLWFFRAGVHANAIQFWPSPFTSPLVENGDGFPGWHIECSAMSKKYLGDTLDIHMGGIEHIPVHHTNEIAQSESANGVKYVNYWLHNEHLLINEEKMAKSAGTSYLLADIKAKGFLPLALRYYFLSANYRSKQNFTWVALQAAQNGLEHLYNQIKEIKLVMEMGDEPAEIGQVSEEYKKKFLEFLNDDFNTPGALAVLQEVIKAGIRSEDKLATIFDFDRVLGLDFEKVLNAKEEVPAEVADLVKERTKARLEKNWAESDRLRAEIETKGFFVEDAADGTKINKK